MKITLKTYFQVLAISLPFFFTSCEKKVVDIVPTDRMTDDQAYNTPARVEANVVGTYEALQSAEFLSGRALVYADILGEDVVDKNGYFGDIPRYTTLSTNGIAYNVWQAGYAAIGRANTFIENVQKHKDVAGTDLTNQYIGEAKFVRAISNFYLVNFFAQPYVFTPDASHPGIPIILQAFTSNDPAANLPRNKVSEVYAQIIKDLTEALPVLPVSYADAYSSKTRATKAAAASLLSRVYLYMADYANAKMYSGDVINGKYGNYSLNADPITVYRNYTTAETIFSIPNNAADNPNTNNALPMHYSDKGRGDLVVSPTFLNQATNPYLAADDKRRTELIAKGTTSGNTNYYFSQKYVDVTNRADWAPVIRYAEVLLTYAEASARLANGIDATAITYLNVVRDRSRVSAPAYTAASFTSKDDLINAILGERRIELAFEGQRIFDLQRTKQGVKNKYDSDVVTILPAQPFGSNKLIFPIPDAEVKKSNNVLQQNAGY